MARGSCPRFIKHWLVSFETDGGNVSYLSLLHLYPTWGSTRTSDEHFLLALQPKRTPQKHDGSACSSDPYENIMGVLDSRQLSTYGRCCPLVIEYLIITVLIQLDVKGRGMHERINTTV